MAAAEALFETEQGAGAVALRHRRLHARPGHDEPQPQDPAPAVGDRDRLTGTRGRRGSTRSSASTSAATARASTRRSSPSSTGRFRRDGRRRRADHPARASPALVARAPRRAARAAARYLKLMIAAAVAAVHRQHGRLGLHRDGPPAVGGVRACCKTATPTRPSVGAARSAITLIGFTLALRRARRVIAGPRRCLRAPRAGPPTPAIRRPPPPSPTSRSPTDDGRLHHAPDLWFVLIAILWTGYFVLEGFDFGVGMLLRAVGRDRPSGGR